MRKKKKKKHVQSRLSPALPPLSYVDWLDNPRNFIDKGNGSRDVIQDRYISNLFPRHRHVLQQLQHCMRHVFKRTVDEEIIHIKM